MGQTGFIMWDCRVAVTLLVTAVWSLFAREGQAATLSADNRQGILQCPSILEVCVGLPGQGTCLNPNQQCDQLTFCCGSLAPAGAPCTTLQASLCQSGMCVEPFAFIELFLPPPIGNKFWRFA